MAVSCAAHVDVCSSRSVMCAFSRSSDRLGADERPRRSAQGQPYYSHDNHTEYDLLDPSTHSFAIVYFLTERRPGATVVLNQTRSGSAGSDISVFDPATGEPLKFEYLSGAELTADGTPGRFDPQEHYIRAHLPRPVKEAQRGPRQDPEDLPRREELLRPGRRHRFRPFARDRAERDRAAEGLQPGVVERRRADHWPSRTGASSSRSSTRTATRRT